MKNNRRSRRATRVAFAAVSTAMLLLVTLLSASPAQANQTLQPGGLSDGEIYCVGDLSTLEYVGETYYENDGDDLFLHKIVRNPYQGEGCYEMNGWALAEDEQPYGGFPPLQPLPEESESTPLISPMPQADPQEQVFLNTQYCVKSPSQAQFSPYFVETEQDRQNLIGFFIRPFPNTVYGCDSYNDLPPQEWERRYGDAPVEFLDEDTGFISVPPGTAVSHSRPSTEWGGPDYRDPHPPVNSSAMTGCDGKYRLMSSNWIMDGDVLYFDLIFGPRSSRARLTASTVYWFCPNGSRADLVRPVEMRYIVTWRDRVPRPYRDTEFDVVHGDVDTIMHPSTKVIPREGDSRQQTGSRGISTSYQRWLQIPQNAAWSASAQVRLADPSIDIDVTFRDDYGKGILRFKPYSDQILSPWYNFYS